jgi:hypothetical protein
MKKFVALGIECAKYLKVARAFEGELFFLSLLSCMLLFAFHLTSAFLLC